MEVADHEHYQDDEVDQDRVVPVAEVQLRHAHEVHPVEPRDEAKRQEEGRDRGQPRELSVPSRGLPEGSAMRVSRWSDNFFELAAFIRFPEGNSSLVTVC